MSGNSSHAVVLVPPPGSPVVEEGMALMAAEALRDRLAASGRFRDVHVFTGPVRTVVGHGGGVAHPGEGVRLVSVRAAEPLPHQIRTVWHKMSNRGQVVSFPSGASDTVERTAASMSVGSSTRRFRRGYWRVDRRLGLGDQAQRRWMDFAPGVWKSTVWVVVEGADRGGGFVVAAEGGDHTVPVSGSLLARAVLALGVRSEVGLLSCATQTANENFFATFGQSVIASPDMIYVEIAGSSIQFTVVGTLERFGEAGPVSTPTGVSHGWVVTPNTATLMDGFGAAGTSPNPSRHSSAVGGQGS